MYWWCDNTLIFLPLLFIIRVHLILIPSFLSFSSYNLIPSPFWKRKTDRDYVTLTVSSDPIKIALKKVSCSLIRFLNLVLFWVNVQQRSHPISIIPHKTKKSYHQVLCAKYDMLRDTLKTEYEFNFLLAKNMEKSTFLRSFHKEKEKKYDFIFTGTASFLKG